MTRGISNRTVPVDLRGSSQSNLDKMIGRQGHTARVFDVDTPEAMAQSDWAPNRISTSLYTPYNFVVKNLFKQFSRFANLYFLFITILQVVPQVTLSSGIPTTVVPLMFVLVINAVKDLIEDVHRHRADRVQNSSPTRELNTTTLAFDDTKWESLRVGSLVLVQQGEVIPADLILLGTSSAIGQCFTMTANLDGETNLKIRWVPPELMALTNLCGAAAASGTEFWTLVRGAKIEVEMPNRRLDRFRGTVTPRGSSQKISVGIANLLLRGVLLRDTEWVVGITIYTGADSKIQQNAGETPFKSSTLSKLTNYMTLHIVLLQLVLLVIAVCVQRATWTDPAYLQLDTTSSTSTLLDSIYLFLTYMLLFSNFVPISLQVTVDITRFFQALVLQRDTSMMYNCVGITVHSSDLNEDLGAIQHIFTDKTGTLTCNNMEFRKCAIDGVSYGGEGPRRISCEAASGDYCVKPPRTSTLIKTYLTPKLSPRLSEAPSPRPPASHVNISDKTLFDKVQAQDPRSVAFFTNLAVNSSVVPIMDVGTNELVYSAISPDEEALVCAAKHYGVVLLAHDTTSVRVRRFGEEVVYEVLHVFEFTSERKKSSMIVRQHGSETLLLLCKGADSVVLPALAPATSTESGIRTAMQVHLSAYAVEGLRVLCVAQRELPPTVYRSWHEKYQAAKTSSDATDEDLDPIIAEIEQNLDLVGITGIEDRLQDGVPDALECFRQARIKVWMLTGDRPDTAVNIGNATKLLAPDMKLVQVSSKELTTSGKPPNETISEAFKSLLAAPTSQELALLMDDIALELICGQEELQREMILASKRCSSVLCCRVSPKQKEFIVDLVRRKTGVITLAIGDGANDVPMIQRAHVGIGISGAEGQQAANASDYAIPQFQCLQRLLLVHGRWINRRMAILTLYMFYKNVLLVLPQFFFGCYCLFSGQSTYYDPLYQLFNVWYTALPILLFSVYDQDVSAASSVAFPTLYSSQSFVNIRLFWVWIADASFSSLVVLFVHVGAFMYGPLSTNGLDEGLWDLGFIMNGIVVLIANLRLALEVKCWFPLTVGGFLFSLLLWLFSSYVFSSVVSFGANFYGVVWNVPNASNALLVVLACTLCLFGVFAVKAYATSFSPRPSDICHEMDVCRIRGVVPVRSRAPESSNLPIS
ncbi:hypothetical protein ACHHYP_04009 [Achlya hypogyna]|uniref:Phospholipid-transporting ATPase n=1 Tax=Achlya hypogyna TaxID=1202772 RepID=A0A1V9Z2P2_ACHHY|nr:hypothetical protein ACHHYP_04009 [Achlya hypogyna]